MEEVFELEALREGPGRDVVLRSQGVPPGAEVAGRVGQLVERATELYESLVRPRGLYEEIGAGEFAEIYRGEGRNACRTPLESVFPQATGLALFTVTLGEPVCERIRLLFEENDPALGCMLDSIASERADTAALDLADRYRAVLLKRGTDPGSARVLPYSPGYCGWDVTGQRRLFQRLRPERIEVVLNDSCLMQPLKSVSGILVAGPGSIHDFDDDFDFCDICATRQCRERIASMLFPVRDGRA